MPIRSRRAAPTALVIVLAALLPAAAASPREVAAAGSTIVFVDEYAYGEQVARVFSPNNNAQISIEWSGISVGIRAEDTDGQFGLEITNVYFNAPQGEMLAVGTYEGATSYPAAGLSRDFAFTPGCVGGDFEILAIDPALELGVPATDFEFAASFSQTCGDSEIHGEVRYNSSEPVSAVGRLTEPYTQAGLAIFTPDAVAGERSAAGTLVLKNYGSQPMTFGAPVFDASSGADFTVSANTCSSSPLAPAATCTIKVRARQWVPDAFRFEDRFSMPASTSRGTMNVRLSGHAKTTRLVPMTPTRILDTRSGLGISAALQTASPKKLLVRGVLGIPAGAIAVVGNLTIVGPTSSGYASLTTTPQAAPTVSTINTKGGDTRANGAIVRINTDGTVAAAWVGTPGSKSHAIFDVTGYFIDPALAPTAAGFNPFKAVRVVDTRTGLGISSALISGVPRTITVPLPSGALSHTAISANLTVVAPARAGYISVTPLPDANPSTSTLNFPAADTRANNLIAQMGTGRKLSIVYKGPAGSSANVILDLTGSFGESGGLGLGYVALIPNRIVDTRIGLGISQAIPSKVARGVPMLDAKPSDPSKNIPSALDARAFTGNATMVGHTAAGYLSVWSEQIFSAPTVSTINAPVGDVRANGVIVGDNAFHPSVAVYYGAAPGKTTHFIFDATGYFVGY